ncbi:MAG: alpha-2-macroglobulin family protein [Bacteroidota bacterium]
MKHLLFTTIFLCFTTLLMAQSDSSEMDNPYAETWTQIDSFLQLGRPQSAYDLVTELQAQIEQDLAEDASLYPHHINVVVRGLAIKSQLGENGLWEAILQLEEVQATAVQPAQAIYRSYLAEQYFQYWQQNSWQLRNRSDRPGEEKTDDPTTWSASDLLARVNELYLSSVSDTSLRNYTIAAIKPLLHTKEAGFELLPTVYDLLLHRALTYYRYNDAFLNEPAYEPSLQKLNLLGSVEEFVQLEIPFSDQPTSFQNVLQLYQEALAWSVQYRPDTRAHLDLNLTRLQVIYQQLTGNAKHAAYEQALEGLLASYQETDLQAFVQAARMKHFYERGAAYEDISSTDQSLRWYWKRALDLASNLKQEFPESVCVQDAQATMNLIEQAHLHVAVEQVQLPEKTGLLYVRYRNVEAVYFKLIATSPERTEYDDWERFLTGLLGRKAERSWSVELPQAGDYHEHATELMLSALPRGKYYLLASADPDFSLQNGQTSLSEFWVSDLAVTYEMDQEAGEVSIMVLERTSGAPIANAEVNLWEYQRRNRSERRNRFVMVETQRTDPDGRIVLKNREFRNAQVQVITDKDQLFLSESQYLSTGQQRTRKNQGLVFFTDRGLYRPGQTVYFKALLLEEDGQVPRIVPNEEVEVSLMDVNRQSVHKLQLTTNRYGSVSGQFTLPTGGLLGQMNLFGTPGRSWHPIRVEEYKRPRFEVEIDDLANEPRLNEEVTVKGSAKAYAGPAVAGAKVNYTVTRSIRFPWANPWFRSYFYQPQEQTVAAGTTESNEQGEFSLTFPAEADADLTEDRFPLYLFNVQVEVVDGTGETRAGNKFIQLSKYPFELQLNTALTQSRTAGVQLEASCQNLDGQDLTKTVQLKVLRRQSPEQNYIDRYWRFPDTLTLSERDFRRNLPNYAYARTELEQYWPDGEAVWEQTVELSGTDTVAISTSDWPVGHYKVIVQVGTTDGDTLSKETTFSLHDWSTGEFAVGQWVYLQTQQEVLQPLDKAKLLLGSPNQPVRIWSQWRNRDGQLQKAWLSANASTGRKLTEADRGGVLWQGIYVHQNRFYTLNQQWQVPWSNKELQVDYEHFRSKLYPDQDEEWTIRISGPEGEGIAAEVLASMYDASLDQILPFSWRFSPFPHRVSQAGFRPSGFQQVSQNIYIGTSTPGVNFRQEIYPQLYRRNAYPIGYAGGGRGRVLTNSAPAPEVMMDEAVSSSKVRSLPTRPVDGLQATAAGLSSEEIPPAPPAVDPDITAGAPPLKVRTNLAETAFFYPQLATDQEGRVLLKFKTPESLTRWRVQLFTHDEDLAFALNQKEVVTQKELMILPNAPRFLREGDQLQFTAKVSNLSEEPLSGEAALELFDLTSQEDLTGRFGLSNNTQTFTVEADASQAVAWTVQVPADAAGTLGYRVVARSGNFSDGEEAALPVLTNRVLLTEAQPLFVRGRSTETFALQRLLDSDSDMDHQAFQLHITSNPAWEAVKALPYLQEYPYDCTEQIVNRLFANTLAAKVIEDYPQAKDVFESWRRSEEGLESPLATNASLKTAVLEETPWVQDAQAEKLQRERIALLFDTDRLATEWAVAQRKLLDRQQPDGGFSWFPGGRTNVYMTQYVTEQLSHLKRLTGMRFDQALNSSLVNALTFCDRHYQERYERWKKDNKNTFPVGPQLVHYLYVRSLNPENGKGAASPEMLAYCWEKTTKDWLSYGLFEQALLGQAAAASGKPEVAQMILTSLRERALNSKELGRYWRQNYGYYWYQSPIETQAKLIEFFQEIDADEEELAEMKIWLLRNKETNRWETTKATAAAVYALLTSGKDWLGETTPLNVSFPKWSADNYEEEVAQAQENAEAGTGAYQVKWDGKEVRPEMGSVRLRNRSDAPAWGALYWQYFQTIDKVSRDSDNGLRVERILYQRINEGEGEELVPINGQLQAGDRITVRLTIRADRDLEFVHLKDLRASGLEPAQQLSQYRYQGGLGYYQQSTDLGTHFFFDYLRKGEYVLEYDLRVFHSGDFSGGLSTIQCMYAPKFTSHSEGRRLVIPE